MDKNKNCSACKLKLDQDFYEENRTSFKICYNKKKRKNNDSTLNQNQQPKIDKVNEDNDNNPSLSANENYRHVFIDLLNVGKTYYMLKKIEKIGNKRRIHIITRSPNQYPNFKTSIDIKPKEKYKE